MTVPSVSLLCQLNSAAQHLEIHMGSFHCEDIFQTLQILEARAGTPEFEHYCCRVLRYALQATLRFVRFSCKRRYSTQNELQASDTKEHTRLSAWEVAARICMSKVSRTTQLFSQKNLSKTLDETRAMLPLLYFLRLLSSSNSLSEGLHFLDI